MPPDNSGIPSHWDRDVLTTLSAGVVRFMFGTLAAQRVVEYDGSAEAVLPIALSASASPIASPFPGKWMDNYIVSDTCAFACPNLAAVCDSCVTAVMAMTAVVAVMAV